MLDFKKINYNYFNEDNCRIEFFLTKRCNYNCPYCDFTNNKCIDHEIPFDGIYELFELLIHKYNKKNIEVVILGGEPTLHSQFNDFINWLEDNEWVSSILVYTNFHDIDTSFFQTFSKLKFNVSIHFDMVTSSNINATIMNIIRSKKIINDIIFMYSENNENYITSVYNKYKRMLPNIEINPLIDMVNGKMKEYKIINDNMKLFKYILTCDDKPCSYYDLISNDMFDFRGYNCKVNTVNISVDYKFDLYNCTGALRENIETGYSLTNYSYIDYLDKYMSIDYIPCTYKFCACDFDYPKEKII